MTGAGSLVRLILRRDRVRLPIWILAIVGIVYASAGAVASAYETPQQIQTYADTVGSSPAAIAMGGPPVALDTIGGILVYETGLTALVGVALMAIFLVVRHTRAEEEEGRTELLRSTVVGPYAPLVASVVVVASAAVLVGLGVVAALSPLRAPLAGTVVYGAAVAVFGLVFMCVAAATAQLMTHARGATGLAATVLAGSFVLRAIGDVRDGTLSWLSPMGWSQQVRAFDDNRWWPLAVSLAFAAVMLASAVVLVRQRDLGSGVIPASPGPAEASGRLSGPVGLMFRLQRGALLGWTVGIFLGGVAFGSMSRELQAMVESNPALAEYFASTGGATLVDSFFATAMLVMSLLGAGFAVASALRLRSEETAGRLEPLLATGLTRTRWYLGSLVVTLLGSATVVAAGGLGVGLSHGLVSDDLAAVPRMLGHSLAYLPAVLVLAALALFLIGWLPRLAVTAWAAVAICFVVGWLGGLLDFPQWLEQLSPFTHTPAAPADPVTVTPLLALTVLAAVGAALGLVGLRRRDLD